MAASRKTGPQSKRNARTGPHTGTRIVAGFGWWRGLRRRLAVVPLGLTLFVVGITLGFGAGLGLTLLPPAPVVSPPVADLPLPVQKPAAKLATAPDAVAYPEILEKASLDKQAAPSEDGSASVDTAAMSATSLGGAVAEEGLHQSAQVSEPPPLQPQPQEAALPASLITPLPNADSTLPLWQKNAVSVRDPGNRPMIAIVLDDVGVAPQHARQVLALPPPIVISIMTYADHAAVLAQEASRLGHEVMVHIPMQPLNAAVNPGPHALTVGLDAEEIRRRMNWGLDRLTGYVGFNNHMGSRFTQDAAGMRVVLELAKARGLLFLDSKTIGSSVGDALAAELGVAHISRDVFLDDDMSEAAVARQLAAAEIIARQRGYAVAIGHPHPATIAALTRWLPQVAARGFAIVPLTAIVKKRAGVAG